MKSKLIWGAIVLASIGFIVVYKLSNSKPKQVVNPETQSAESARWQQEVKMAVAEMSGRYNAITDWEKQLSKGENVRYSPVLTIELEYLWQSERPVLFIGSIKDISSTDDDRYKVILEPSIYNMNYTFDTELRLSLIAEKSGIDSFLKTHPKVFAGKDFTNGVAVLAKIHSIRASDTCDINGESGEVKTGQGKLIEMIYTGDVIF